jgi:tetratricopeptide (TPR) repeat protein
VLTRRWYGSILVALLVTLIAMSAALFQSVRRNILALGILHRAAVVPFALPVSQLPTDIEVLRLSSIQLLIDMRYEEAFMWLDRIPPSQRISLDWMRLAIAAAHLGRMEEALVDVDRAAMLTDTLVQWGRENWRVLQGKDNPVLANLWFSAASRRSDGSLVSRRDLGVWWLWQDPKRAVLYLEPVWKENPLDPWSNYLLAKAYWDVGNRNLAISRMEQANTLLAYSASQYCAELVRMYQTRQQSGDVERARIALQLCLAKRPNDETLQHLLTEVAEP